MNQTNDQWEIYLAETDSNSLESGGWISPSEFTKVFHGDVRFSSEYYGVGTGQHKQLIVELDTPFVRDPSKNLVIAVRDNEGGAQASSKNFELRNLGDAVNYKTLVLGSNSPIDLNAVSGTAQSYHSRYVPWVIIEGVTESGITYSSSTETNDAGILAPGETETYTATYTISQAAFDSGGVSNSLTVSLENDAGDIISDVSDNDGDDTNGGDTPTDDSFTQSPSADVTKSVTIVDNGDTFNGLDDILQYEIEIKNTGDVTLTNITLTDELKDFADPAQDLTITEGPTYLFNGTNGIDASKIDRFEVGGNWFELIREKKTYLEAKALAQKRGGKLYRLKYTSVDGSTEKDILIQHILDTLDYRQLDISTSVITENDPTSTTPKNYLWINGEDIDQEGEWNHIEFDGTKVSWDSLNINFTAAQQDDENGTTMPENNLGEQDALGWALTEPYGWNDIDVDNQLYYVIEYESNNIDWIGSGQTTLAPGESMIYSVKFKIDDQAVDAGGVTNQATVNFTGPDGVSFDVLSDDPSTTEVDDSTDVELIFPDITVLKTVDNIKRQDTNGDFTVDVQQDEVVVGDKITFNISATNTGNWPLINLQVTDTIIDSRGNNEQALTSLVTIVSDNGVAVDSSTFDGELAVDETVVYQVQYTVLESSSIAPIILNSATVSGDAMTDLDGDGTDELFGTTTDISDDGLTGDDDTGDDPTKVYLAPNPIIEVIKTVSSIKQGPGFTDDVAQGDVNVGDKVFFEIVATNTGNWPLVNIQAVDTITHARGDIKVSLPLTLISDAGVLVSDTPFDGELAAGDSLVYTTSYTVPSSADITPELLNSAVVEADVMTDLDGDGTSENLDSTISDISDDGDTGAGDTGDDPTKVFMTPLPAIEVTKTVAEIKREDTNGVYTIDVTEGNVQVGDKIVYHISATNTGNWPLVNVQVVDTIIDSNGNNQQALIPDLLTDAGVSIDSSTFDGEIAAGDTLVYSVEYIILNSSSNAAFISNFAIVQGDVMYDADGDGNNDDLHSTVSDLSDGDTDTVDGNEDGDFENDPTDVDLAPDPKLTVTKTAVVDDGDDDILGVDDIITYTILVENTGNLPLTNLSLKDSLYNLQGDFKQELSLTFVEQKIKSTDEATDNGEGNLIPGEEETYTAQYTIIQSDVDSSGILNSVTATAKDPDDNDIIDVSDGDSDPTLDSDGDTDPENDPTETLITQSPAIEVTKTYRIEENNVEFLPFGSTVGTSLSDLDNTVGDNQYHSGFVSLRSISKPGEFFEFRTNGYRDFAFGLAKADDFSPQEIQEYFNSSSDANNQEQLNKSYYVGTWYENNGDFIQPIGYFDPLGSSADFTGVRENEDLYNFQQLRSVSRVRIGFSDTGTPTIWGYSINPNSNNSAPNDNTQEPDPTIEFIAQTSTVESYDPNSEYHFMFKPISGHDDQMDKLDINLENGAILGDVIVYEIKVENKGNVTLSNLELLDQLRDHTSAIAFKLEEQLVANGNIVLADAYYSTTNNGQTSVDAPEDIGTLEVGETETYIVRFVVSQEAIDAHIIHNQVTATASSPQGTDDVSDVSDDGDNTDGNSEG